MVRFRRGIALGCSARLQRHASFGRVVKGHSSTAAGVNRLCPWLLILLTCLGLQLLVVRRRGGAELGCSARLQRHSTSGPVVRGRHRLPVIRGPLTAVPLWHEGQGHTKGERRTLLWVPVRHLKQPRQFRPKCRIHTGRTLFTHRQVFFRTTVDTKIAIFRSYS